MFQACRCFYFGAQSSRANLDLLTSGQSWAFFMWRLGFIHIYIYYVYIYIYIYTYLLFECIRHIFASTLSQLYIYIYFCLYSLNVHVRRKFRSQTSDNMERWKAEQGRGREKRKISREKIRRERVRRQKIQMREKVGKSRNTVFFQWFVAPEGRKVGSLKRRVRSQLARGAMKNCTPLWCEAHFQVKMYKTPILGPLLEVEMSKKCTPLWREAHFEVKSVKNWRSRTTFGSCDVEKVHAIVARSTFRSQNVQNTTCSRHFWRFRCRKSARRCGAKHISKSKCPKH